MARSPHCRRDVAAALKAAEVEGSWDQLASSRWWYKARNGAGFYFDEPYGIFFRGPTSESIKVLVRAIWSYEPPPKPLMDKSYFKGVQARMARAKRELM